MSLSPSHLTLIFTFIMLILFVIISKVSKQQDYLLDDYTEEDAPDNVRVINKEVRIIDESKLLDISNLNDNLRSEIDIANSKNDILEKEALNIENLEKNIININESILHKTKEISDLKVSLSISEKLLSKITSERDLLKSKVDNLSENINRISDEKDKVNKVVEELSNNERTYISDINRLEKSINQKNKELSKLEQRISSIKEDNLLIEKELEKVTKDNDKYIYQINTHKKDVDFFMNGQEQSNKNIKKLEKKIEVMNNSDNLNIISGVDGNGSFISIENINFGEKTNSIIEDLYNQLDSDQVGYYVYNTVSGVDNYKIVDISEVDEFIHKLNVDLDKVKYKRYLIIGEKVYMSI